MESREASRRNFTRRVGGFEGEAARDLELVKTMHGAGVQFMAGSDGPDPYVFPGFSLHDELEWLVKSGFTPFQALQSATFDPAVFLRKIGQYGLVEPGHAADLLLLDANPLDDIRNTRKIFGGGREWQVLFPQGPGHDAAAGREAGGAGIDHGRDS